MAIRKTVLGTKRSLAKCMASAISNFVDNAGEWAEQREVLKRCLQHDEEILASLMQSRDAGMPYDEAYQKGEEETGYFSNFVITAERYRSNLKTEEYAILNVELYLCMSLPDAVCAMNMAGLGWKEELSPYTDSTGRLTKECDFLFEEEARRYCAGVYIPDDGNPS